MTETDRQATNHFDQVDDFKWLKAEQNPNWSVLRPDERVGEDVWADVVPGKAGAGHGDILRAVNARRSLRE